MNTTKVIMVRAYITESSHLLNDILQHLKIALKLKGVTVFRAIRGFGEEGEHGAASLIDLSLNLPLVIEFFEQKEKAYEALNYLNTVIKPEHIVFWDAQINQ